MIVENEYQFRVERSSFAFAKSTNGKIIGKYHYFFRICDRNDAFVKNVTFKL
jgi:hypothetical protein